MPHLLGIDIGTSGTKTLLCNERGKVLATAMAEHPISAPKPGWSEQNPLDWWKATVAATRAVRKRAGLKPADIHAIGLSGQMHGSVFLGDGPQAPAPAILWNDQRTAEQCAQIESRAGGRAALIELVANPALTGFTAPKILWLRQHEPKVYEKTKHILLPKDYIRYRLTGDYATEVSDASGTLLLDVVNRRWSDRLLELLEIDRSLLPRMHESPDVTGTLTAAAADELGLSAGTRVVGGGGDQAAGAVGNGVVSSGIVSATLGTSGVVFAHSDQPTRDPLGRVHTLCHAVPGKWCVFGCMLSAGGSFQWFRNNLAAPEVAEARKKKIDPYSLLIRQAQQAPPGCEGLQFLPYLTGERCPYPDPHARGGLDRHHRPHHPPHAHPRPARRRHLRHARRPRHHAIHENPHLSNPRQRRRRTQPILAPTPSQHLPPAHRHHQRRRRPRLRRRPPGRRRHRCLDHRRASRDLLY